MKLGRLIPVVAFLASSSAWAGVVSIAPPFSVNKVMKLQNKVDSVDGDKIKTTNYDNKDLGAAMCGRDLENGEKVVAVIPCPVSRLPDEGLYLAIYDKKVEQESACERIPVSVTDYVAANDGLLPPNITQISANLELSYAPLDLVWLANAEIDAKIVKDKKSSLDGLNCVNKVKGSTGTGLVDGDPISSVKLKIGNVKGGASELPPT
jgi:hypothetical protein